MAVRGAGRGDGKDHRGPGVTGASVMPGSELGIPARPRFPPPRNRCHR